MNNTMEYKGYVGSVEFSEEDVMKINSQTPAYKLDTSEDAQKYAIDLKENARELVEGFHEAVDEYLLICEQQGKVPEQAYKGSFNVRISPELHKKIVIYATEHDITLNRYVEQTLEKSPAAVQM